MNAYSGNIFTLYHPEQEEMNKKNLTIVVLGYECDFNETINHWNQYILNDNSQEQESNVYT